MYTLSNSLVVVLGELQSTLCLTHKSSKICLASGMKKRRLSFITIKKKLQLITNPEKLDLLTVKHYFCSTNKYLEFQILMVGVT